ncbi:hypothetical protein DL98DRAFT_513732 [Cadophora sp. DSE1049]|nr:hypothetical protein DL98DRAFT_513732 [Cadophora sp. DSE1049]
MSISTSTTYFDTPRKTRDTTFSHSPAASPSVYATSQPQCIHDIGVITAQLVSENACIRSRCLALYKDQRRCAGSFVGQSRPKILSEVEGILQGTDPVSAEQCGRFVMRILFCRRHNESDAYKRQLGCFYEKYEPWRGDMSPVELEFLSAIRKVFQFPPAQSADDITTPLVSDNPGKPTPRQIRDAENPGLDSDFHRFEDAEEEEGPMQPPVNSSHPLIDGGPGCQGCYVNSKSLPEHNTSQSDTNAQYDKSHALSEKVIYAIDEPMLHRNRRAAPANSLAFLRRLSPKSPAKLRTERAGQQNEEAGFDNHPKVSASSETAQSTNLSFGAYVDEALSSQAVGPDSSHLTEDFSPPDWDDGDADLSAIEGSPAPVPVSGRWPNKRPPACKSGNTNDNILHTIKKPIAKEGFVYVLRAPQYSAKHFPDELPLVKIGKAMKPEDRVNNISTSCDISDLERVLDIEDSRCRYYYQIEKLVHAELSAYQRILKCDCKNGANHREWFAVPETVALQSIQRWRRFMRQDPYDGRGILRDVWSEMTDWENSQQGSGDEHENRHRYWNAWLDEGISRVAAIKSAAINGGT